MSLPSSLPALSADAAAHSQRLVDAIRDELEAAGGWMSFERYMEMALYQPGLGYYSAGACKLGAEGDFVTAPEISALFSRCVAHQCAQVLDELPGGDILELGAGSGVMAADILAELHDLNRLPQRYLILEVSADLRERQRATLGKRVPQLLPRVQWLDALPTQMTGIVVGNEVLDALPVRRFMVRGEHVSELGVTYQLGKLEWSEARADDALVKRLRAIETQLEQRWPDGYCSEINVRLPQWLQGVTAALDRGVILLIDYGLSQKQYYSVERTRGTLLCHYRHRFHDDPFINVGLQDIGAWVDFTAVADAAVDSGCSVIGYTTQAHFLIGAGIEKLLADLAASDLKDRVQIGRQAMALTLPGEMGERFKAIALGKNWESPLKGFQVRDFAASL